VQILEYACGSNKLFWPVNSQLGEAPEASVALIIATGESKQKYYWRRDEIAKDKHQNTTNILFHGFCRRPQASVPFRKASPKDRRPQGESQLGM